MGGRSKEGLDSNGLKGLAKPDYEKIVAMSDTIQDKTSILDKLLPAYRYMVAYYYNVKGDVANAAKYNDLILAVSPTDENAMRNKEPFEKLMKSAAQKGPAKN